MSKWEIWWAKIVSKLQMIRCPMQDGCAESPIGISITKYNL